jgi:integrase/recombinase XerD
MNTWPDTDGNAIDRYLGQLRLRCPVSPIYYRQALHSFREVVAGLQRSPSQVSREALEAWLRERSTHWPESTLLHRARIVNRFLDFLVREALIVSNPVADLRAEYHVKSDKAILRALLAPDPDQALASLRQFPPFDSILGDLMRNHIALMQARGYRYQTQARWFWRFDRFLQARPELAGESVTVMLQHWVAARPTANHAAECERLARALAKAQHHVDPDTKPRRPDPRPAQQVARQWRRPYIYSPEDVRRLLDIARTYPSPRSPLRPISLYTMLVLTYCAGLRLGELARLNLVARFSQIEGYRCLSLMRAFGVVKCQLALA